MKIQFEFHGGFKDGESVLGTDEVEDASNPVRVYLHLTSGGRIGVRFSEYPSAADVPKVLNKIADRKDWLSAEFETIEECERKSLAARIPWTYEVTEREEQPDRVLIRLDAVGSVLEK